MIRLLHIAPEKNLQKALKAFSKIKYISGDLNPLVADRKIDITNINFENDYFDFIICNHVLEHVKDDRKAMCELFRVLKTEGFAILQVSISKRQKKPLKIFQLLLQKKEKSTLDRKTMLEYMVRIITKN